MEWQELLDLSEGHPIIFFDGVCRLCNGFVNYVIRHDPKNKIRFCALQDKNALQLRKELQLGERIDTVIGLHKGEVYSHSDVVFLVARELGGYWFILPLQWLPGALEISSIDC